MRLRPFLLDTWLREHEEPPVEFNLGSSTGPHWTLGEVLDLEEGSRDRLFGSEVSYPPSAGTSRLREAIARMEGVDAEHVLVVAGASEALLHVFFAAAEPGANVLVPFPGFPTYHAVPEAFGMEVRCYQLRYGARYAVDPDELGHLADSRTAVLVVNSPHNPTGAVVTAGEMRALYEFAENRGIQLVSDQVFHPIYHDRKGASASVLPNATVVGDLSKAMSLPGLRLGWILERNDERRARYLNARQYFTISNNRIGEQVAAIAIENRDVILARTREVTRANLRHVDVLMENHRDALEWVRPDGGMTCFPRLRSGGNSRSFCEEAVGQGLLLVPGDCFGVRDHFRLGFGVGPDSFPVAMDRLGTLLTKAARRGRPATQARRGATYADKRWK